MVTKSHSTPVGSDRYKQSTKHQYLRVSGPLLWPPHSVVIQEKSLKMAASSPSLRSKLGT